MCIVLGARLGISQNVIGFVDELKLLRRFWGWVSVRVTPLRFRLESSLDLVACCRLIQP
jgi:hypothetical protein